jgi:hypothetical protein
MHERVKPYNQITIDLTASTGLIKHGASGFYMVWVTMAYPA